MAMTLHRSALRGGIALITVVSFVSICRGASRADVTFDLRNGPGAGGYAVAPVTLNFLGINPARFYVEIKVGAAVNEPPPQLPTALTGGAVSSGRGAAPGAAPKKQTPLDKIEGRISLATGAISPLITELDTKLQTAFAQSDPTSAVRNIASNEIMGSGNAYHIARDAAVPLSQDYQSLKNMQTSGSDADRIKRAESKIEDLQKYYPFLFSRDLLPSDFDRAAGPFDCKGVGAGSRTYPIKVTMTDLTNPSSSQSGDYSVACQSRFTTSAGFVFSWLQQNTYSANARNGAVVPPAGVPTPGATVQLDSSNSTRSIPAVFVHYQLSQSCDGHCSFLSFGAATDNNNASTSSGTTLNYAIGYSYGLAGYLFLTVGGNLGNYTTPAAGFDVGAPITVGAKVPTVVRERLAPFVSITFGPGATKSTAPSGNASPQPAPSPTPTRQ